jgi:sulfate permease, SulP family
VLGDAITRLERRGITVLLSGIASAHDEVLATLGIADRLRRDHLIFPDTPSAIEHARQLLATHLAARTAS